MDRQDSYESSENSVEVIRDDIRHEANIKRKQRRTTEWNKHRAGVSDDTIHEDLWNLAMVIKKSEELIKKPLSIDDYRKLQTALIQDKENIKGFLSINNTILALMRDLSSSSPAIKLSAAHCCCNITLGSNKQCSTLYKYAGPHLVRQLETSSNPLLEVSAWTIGNLCSGTESTFKFLYAQGCIRRLNSLLRECDTMILPSIIYAILHCLYRGSELLSDAETVDITQIFVERACFESPTELWCLALLSSRIACRAIIFPVLSQIFDKFVEKVSDKCFHTSYVTAAIRVLANSVSKSTESSARIIFCNPKYTIEDIKDIFDALLIYPHDHVRREILWLLGNLYNNSSSDVIQSMLIMLKNLENLEYSIKSIKSDSRSRTC